MLFSLETSGCSLASGSTDDSIGVDIGLAIVMGFSVVGVMISVVINILFFIKLKQSRCVVTNIYMYSNVAINNYCYCRPDVSQSSMKYSEVNHSMSADNPIIDSIRNEHVEPSEPEYDDIMNMTLGNNVNVEVNPAYTMSDNDVTIPAYINDVKMEANPAYQASN